MTVIRPEPDFSTETTLREVRDAVEAQSGGAVDTTALAKDATLSSLLTELAQKLEPSDLTALATAAKQDTLKAAVDAITAKLSSDPATQTTLAAIGTLLGAGLPSALSGGRLKAATASDVLSRTTVGVGPAGTPSATVAIPDGASTVTVFLTASALNNATVTMQVSADGGTTWQALPGVVVAAPIGGVAAAGTATATPIASNTVGSAVATLWEAGLPVLPAGALFRLSPTGTSITAGSAAVVMAANQVEPTVAITNTVPVSGTVVVSSATLSTSTNNVGYVRAAGVGQDDSIAALAANAVFTGTSRDLSGSSQGAGWAQSSNVVGMGTVEARGLAVSDVAGTLCLEVSRDNVTWRRIRSVAMSNVGTDAVGAGTIYEAEISYRPATRYARWVFVNGAVAQTHFMLQSFLLSA